MKYHIPQNSFYVTVDKVRYKNAKYSKCIVSYYYKFSDVKLCTEKNVKIRVEVMDHWEVWSE